jgi:hypothetical protein
MRQSGNTEHDSSVLSVDETFATSLALVGATLQGAIGSGVVSAISRSLCRGQRRESSKFVRPSPMARFDYNHVILGVQSNKAHVPKERF